MQFQLKAQSEAIQEIRSSIGAIADAVSVLKVVELRAEQQRKTSEELATSLRALQGLIQEVRTESASRVQEANKDVVGRVHAAETELAALEADWGSKYNKLVGIVLGVSAVFGIASAVATYSVSNALRKVEASYEYILQLKALDADKRLKILPAPVR